ncbi:MAG: proton-conducting transporter membrane subunit [Steroidobacteraceae bacterium]
MPDALIIAFWLWCAGLLLGLARAGRLARVLLALGALVGICGVVATLPHASTPLTLTLMLADQPVTLDYSPQGLWLLGFGLAPAILASALGTPVRNADPGWTVGAALSLIGALGVFGLQDGYSFLIAWELMSLGGAVMILSERLGSEAGHSTLFMLSVLEFGAVAILLAFLLLGVPAHGSFGFAHFAAAAPALSTGLRVFIGVLLLLGFGAKLGLLPFYEWFPNAYGNGSGATGALMSGVVLNAAFFALSRGLTEWLPGGASGAFALGVITVTVAVVTSILAALYAFQQDDWRRLLSFSSAENAAIAVIALGASLLFRSNGEAVLAGLAWTVAILHLSGHSLAKGTLFLCADGIFNSAGSYRLVQRGWLRHAGIGFGIGALFAVMSLAALPPQIGFVTEWFTFQTLFQGFHLATLGGRLTLALAGAGLALTAAVALATFVKAFGIGLLGTGGGTSARIAPRYAWASLALGLAVLAAAVGLPVWLSALNPADVAEFGAPAAHAMVVGWILVPLTNTFAFISPSLLVIVMPLLALVPLGLLLTARRYAVRRSAVWYGGMPADPGLAQTTSLTFSNATRTFYSFIYRPTLDTAREHRAVSYFIHRLEFRHDIADVFGPILFRPLRRLVWGLAGRMRAFQSGDLNFYLALIGALLIVILALTLA